MFGILNSRIGRSSQKLNWPFVLNEGSPQASGLVAWWPGAAATGSKILDLSGFTQHGTLNNFGFSNTSGWIPGNGGGSGLVFDGTDDFVSMTGGSKLNVGNVFTVMGWFQYVDLTRRTIIGRNNAAGAWQVELNGSHNDDLNMIISGTFIASISASSLLIYGGTNRWIHFVYSRSGTGAGTHAWWLNGRSHAESVNNATNYSDSSTFEFGRRASASQMFNGKLEDVRVYNRVLSGAEIWKIYDPATRWQLRYRPGAVSWFVPSLDVAPPQPICHLMNLW